MDELKYAHFLEGHTCQVRFKALFRLLDLADMQCGRSALRRWTSPVARCCEFAPAQTVSGRSAWFLPPVHVSALTLTTHSIVTQQELEASGRALHASAYVCCVETNGSFCPIAASQMHPVTLFYPTHVPLARVPQQQHLHVSNFTRSQSQSHPRPSQFVASFPIYSPNPRLSCSSKRRLCCARSPSTLRYSSTSCSGRTRSLRRTTTRRPSLSTKTSSTLGTRPSTAVLYFRSAPCLGTRVRAQLTLVALHRLKDRLVSRGFTGSKNVFSSQLSRNPLIHQVSQDCRPAQRRMVGRLGLVALLRRFAFTGASSPPREVRLGRAGVEEILW